MSALDSPLRDCTLRHKVLGAPLKAEAEAGAAQGLEAVMRRWLRRIRGAIGLGFTWAAALSVAGLVPRWVFGLNTDVPIPLVFGVFGSFAGVTFSGLLVLAESGRRFDQLTLPRFAGWAQHSLPLIRPCPPGAGAG
jgi:hypothetical protein